MVRALLVPLRLGWLLMAAAVSFAADPREARLQPVAYDEVRVAGELGRRIDITIDNHLLKLDLDQFLTPFRQRTARGGYIGLGKLIDAVARFAAYRPEHRLKTLNRKLLRDVIALQEPDGYLGMMAPQSRIHALWDIHELSYVAHGLITEYELFGETVALEAARKIADYIIRHWHELPADWPKRTGVATHLAVTSLERTLIRLWRVTGDDRYKDFCLRQRQLADWAPPIELGRRPLIKGHIYAYVCRALAGLELYRHEPRDGLVEPAKRAVRFLLREDGLTVTGGAGQWECWTDDQDGRIALGETCATAYQIRLYDRLLRLSGRPEYGDLIERTVYNALFGAQSPDGRRIRYYTPFEGKRAYFELDTYCCPGNYRRIIAELPLLIYYRHAEGLAINLYAESRYRGRLPDGTAVTLVQRTRYPSSGSVEITVDPVRPARFALWLRVPLWATGATVRVNDGQPEPVSPGTYCKLSRRWRPGDRVSLNLPLRARLVRGRKQQYGRVAVLCGPLVYCLNPARNAVVSDWAAADLCRLTLDAKTLTGPLPDDSMRPGGTCVKVRAWPPGYRVVRPADFELVLTEFADPGGRATYFKVMLPAVVRDDELVGLEL